MRRERRSTGECGFTLIELLVVISIVVMLMALLIPVLRKARKHAQAVACQSNLHQWAMAFQEHTTEHDGRWFRGGPGAEPGPNTWPGLRFSYANPRWGLRIDLCPAPTWSKGRRTGSSYSLNAWIHDYQDWHGDTSHFTMSYYWRHVDAARSPGSVPVYLDAYARGWCAPQAQDEPPPYADTCTFSMGHFCVPRHGSFVNAVFMDWSVRRVGLKELWTLKWHRQYDTTGPWTKAGGVLPTDWPQWMRGFRDY